MLDIILDWDPDIKGNVSKIYKIVQANSSPSLDKTKSAWEQDLHIELTEEMWEHSLHRIHTTSLCFSHCLIQFKELHRLYFIREKLSKFCNVLVCLVLFMIYSSVSLLVSV